VLLWVIRASESTVWITWLSLTAPVLRVAPVNVRLAAMCAHIECEALWDRLDDQFKTDVRAAIDRVHETMPDDPNAEGLVAIALRDLADEHRV
jgi:hypothetical protein